VIKDSKELKVTHQRVQRDHKVHHLKDQKDHRVTHRLDHRVTKEVRAQEVILEVLEIQHKEDLDQQEHLLKVV
jgi:hypothetical protein